MGGPNMDSNIVGLLRTTKKGPLIYGNPHILTLGSSGRGPLLQQISEEDGLLHQLVGGVLSCEAHLAHILRNQQCLAPNIQSHMYRYIY